MDQTQQVSEESVQRYVTHASDRCMQDLLSASRPELADDWKLYKIKRGVEISRRYQGPVMVVRGRSYINVPPAELQSLASAIETAKVSDIRMSATQVDKFYRICKISCFLTMSALAGKFLVSCYLACLIVDY
jgi:hypothetical protein